MSRRSGVLLVHVNILEKKLCNMATWIERETGQVGISVRMQLLTLLQAIVILLSFSTCKFKKSRPLRLRRSRTTIGPRCKSS